MAVHRKLDIVGNLCALGSLLCWCTVPLFIKYFTDYFDPVTQNGLRYSVAALVWLPALIFMIRSGKVPGHIWAAALIPTFVNICGQTLWAWSLYYLDPGMVGFVVKLNTVWGTILAIIFFADERNLVRSRSFWCGMILSGVGFVLMVGAHPQLRLSGTIAGLAIIIGCSVFWALYAVTVRWKMARYAPIPAFAVIAIYTAAGCDVLMLLFGEPAAVGQAGSFTLLMLLISAVLGIGLAHVFYYGALNRLGVAITSGILLIVPFVTAVLSMAIFGERLGSVQWLGGAVLVGGTALLVAAQRVLGQPAE